MYRKYIFPIHQVFADLKFVGNEHILTVTDFLPIEIIVGNAIHTFEHKKNMFPGFGALESTLIPPLPVFIPLGLPDILAHVKIPGKITRL